MTSLYPLSRRSATRTPIDRPVSRIIRDVVLAALPETTFEEISVVSFKNRQAGVEQFALGDDHDVKSRCDLVTTENLSYQTFSAIPHDRSAQLLCGGDAKATHRECIPSNKQCAVAAVNACALFVDLLKLDAAADPLEARKPGHALPHSLLIVSRFRPLARRRLITRRPFFVLMRTRNPCVFRRCRLFGWNVRTPLAMRSLQRRTKLQW